MLKLQQNLLSKACVNEFLSVDIFRLLFLALILCKTSILRPFLRLVSSESSTCDSAASAMFAQYVVALQSGRDYVKSPLSLKS